MGRQVKGSIKVHAKPSGIPAARCGVKPLRGDETRAPGVMVTIEALNAHGIATKVATLRLPLMEASQLATLIREARDAATRGEGDEP